MCDTAGTDPPAPTPALKPCLAELLRTRVAPPTLVVRVEHILPTATLSRPSQGDGPPSDHDVDHAGIPPHDDDRSWCLRLAVSDGHLQIQAVVSSEAHTKELSGLRLGDLIELKKYRLRSAPRVNGHGRVVFLGVEKCGWIERDSHLHPHVGGGGEFLREDSVVMASSILQGAERRGPQLKRAVSDLGALHKRAQEDESEAGGAAKKKRKKKKKGQMGQHPSTGLAQPLIQQRRLSPSSEDSDDDSFDTMAVTNSQAERRREVLRQIQQNMTETLPARFRLEADRRIEDEPSITVAPPTPPPIDLEESDGQTSHIGDPVENREHSTSATPSDPEKLPSTTDTDAKVTPTTATTTTTAASNTTYEQQFQFEHKPTPSSLSTAPIHNLSSLLSPTSSIPRRNYPCTVFAVISWISPSTIHRPNTPFPPKRHIKIHDPSISQRYSGVTLAVFVDARAFLPKVGTVALFRAVVMQRWQGEVILNKYPPSVGAASPSLEEEDWFVSDEEVLEGMGFDVRGMRLWWENRARKQG